ncbi:dehydrogenase/reductase SDR family member 13 isoform X1 [Zootoca vivipara]|uniref:dehydrogenase/reductase SDR family member 13 isoform X1 n=1 Tax=Zootoca vivipara TaxID=8524 RepID=UPI0015921A76|nr:dehydrogenase/reductase SDR family member 13 isoform X1 [Zootoca vivipara]
MAAAEALAGLALALGLYALLYYNFIKGATCKNEASLRGKTVVITGGNTGIGKATALDLARRGARVILACRDRGRGESAVCDIRRESGNNEVLFMSLDLASFKSVRTFAAAFLRSEPRLDILINNAGVRTGSRSSDGFNLAFQVNHLSHFLLTHLLLERMKQCAPSRVVVVASSAHQRGKIDFQNIHKPVDGQLAGIQSYSNSKLANMLYTRELANRLEGTNVTCYAVHPGLVNTELFRHTLIWLKPLFLPICWLFLRDTTNGAQTSIYCATQEGIEKYSGRYFANCWLRDPKPHARDDALAKKLWEVSERMVGLAN